MTTRTIETRPLPTASMGTTRSLTVVRYGDGTNGPKAYLQAGLHANEPPGLLVMHHLMERLDQADEQGHITGEIVLVPVANPIGISQWRNEYLQGRFDFYDNINFNREFPDLTERIAERIKDRLTDDAAHNIVSIRRVTGELLRSITPDHETAWLKHTLLRLCHDADIVLDLHCDCQAVTHIYLGTPLWPEAADLSAQMGAMATLLAADSGVTPFDEAASRIWWQLAQRFPSHPIPPACLAATVELRGQTDVTHELASADAENLFTFLQRRGFIQGNAPALPKLEGDATPLRAVAHIKAPVPGVVVFCKRSGEKVVEGDKVAEIIDPLEPDSDQRIHPLHSPIDGLIFTTNLDRYARPGRSLVKIAGTEPLKKKGENLLTL